VISRETCRRINWFFAQQVGVDLLRLVRFPFGLARYLKDFHAFRRTVSSGSDTKVFAWPCLHDWYEQAGATDNEYFWQDLFVARMIHCAAPERHVDVGSRLDGFVAHLASFREVEVFDIRPLKSVIPGVVFKQADMMKPDANLENYADSLSCLHALEHFGLGRYGDPLNVDGPMRGLASLAKMVKPGGTMYLACPYGQDAVYFNAHRTIHPHTLDKWARSCGLQRRSLHVFNTVSQSFLNVSSDTDANRLAQNANFTLGVYVFEKCS
jgi:hypothetical protein